MVADAPKTLEALTAGMESVRERMLQTLNENGDIDALAVQYAELTLTHQRMTREANAGLINAAKTDLLAIVKAAVEKSGLADLMGEPVTSILYTVTPNAAGGDVYALSVNAQSGRPAGSAGTNTDAPTSGRIHQRIGSRLLREHQTLPMTDHRLGACAKGYFSANSTPYQKPDSFPAVLFDPDGYFIITDEPSMGSNPYISVGKRISIPDGVHSIPGYRRCGHEHR